MKLQGHYAGWISKKYGICWSVNRYRKDKRTGVIHKTK